MTAGVAYEIILAILLAYYGHLIAADRKDERACRKAETAAQRKHELARAGER